MRFGMFTSMGNQTWPAVLELWKHAEATKWDVACVTDHFMPNTKEREGAMLEGWSTLTALSTLVPRIQVGTIVLGDTYRHPAVVAKMATQVDIISGGRLLLGLGAGWQENEHEAYGIPFYTMRRSANMALLITDKKAEVDALAETIGSRMGRHAADARDTCLAGTPEQIRATLAELRAAKVETLFIPTLFRPLPELRRDLDRFITEIAPAFR